MRTSIQLQDRHAEQRVFKVRAITASLIGAVFFFVLIGRLVYLQVLGHEHFSMLSQNNRVRLFAKAPPRGLIFDRQGRILAENIPSRQLEIIPEQVQDLNATLTALSGMLDIRAIDLERFRKAYQRAGAYEGVPLLFNLSEAEASRFSIDKHHFPGVDIAAHLSRHYPYAEAGVHAIGYVGRIDEDDLQAVNADNYKGTSHIGKTGVERHYEALLHGVVGAQQAEVNVEGRVLRELDEKPAVPGDNIFLSLDMEFQVFAERLLGEHSGSIVALDPNSGEVLAFVSKPTYDPHLFVNGIGHEAYDALNNATSRPLYNRALKGQYPPGSTLKPIIGLTALEANVENYSHALNCYGYYTLPNDTRRYRDWLRTGHGRTNLHDAIIRSCDVFFYDLARRMGIDMLSDGLKHFALGERTGIDLEGEKSGLVPSREWKQKSRGVAWYPGETLSAGLGQGYMLATPLQLAVATAALANNGRVIKPRLLRAVQTSAGVYRETQTEIVSQIKIRNPEHLRYVQQAMQDVVHGERGTARHISHGASYKMAGKTGTAQVIGIKQGEEYDAEELEKHLHDHALFIVYAPVEMPEIAVAIIVENGGSGGRTAAPLARQLLDYYFNHVAKLSVAED